jgi:hypothetical protein
MGRLSRRASRHLFPRAERAQLFLPGPAAAAARAETGRLSCALLGRRRGEDRRRSLSHLSSLRRSAAAHRRVRSRRPHRHLLREQEDFLPSLHNQLVYNGEEPIEDFERAWRLSGQRRREEVPACCDDLRLLDYKAAGRFSEQVHRYFAQFPTEQIRVLQFRDWVAHPRQTYLEVLDFLGLPDDGRTNFAPLNEARRRRTRLFVRLARGQKSFGCAMLSKLPRSDVRGFMLQVLTSAHGTTVRLF